MKKILFFASALAGLFFAASCQQEEFAPVEESNVVTFEVSVPEVATKGIGDDVSNINDLVYAVYWTGAESLKAVQEGKPEDLKFLYSKNYAQNVNPFNGTGRAIVEIELLKDKNYIVLFWAQNDDQWVIGDDFDLRTVSYPDGMTANNNNLAAFSGVSFISKNNLSGKKDVTLKRPFAQLNIGTTLPNDKIGDQHNFDVTIEGSSVEVKNAGTSFNLIKQKAEGKGTVSFDEDQEPVNPDHAEGKLVVNGTAYTYAAMNYVFANGNVDVDFVIDLGDYHGTVTNTVSNVPVAANYRTNIVGNLLTATSEYSVVLDQNWGDAGKDMEVITEGLVKNINGDYEITTAKGFAFAINNLFKNGGKFYVLNSIDMTGVEYDSSNVPAGVTVELVGQIPVVTRSVVEPITITGLGHGAIIDTNNGSAIFSNIEVEGSDDVSETPAFINVNNGTADITNCEASHQSFIGENKGNVTESGNTTPENTPIIKEDNGETLTKVGTADALVEALEANKGVLFLNDIQIDPANMSNAYGKTGINVKNGQTIDGDGHILNIQGAGGTWDSGINTTGGLIKNITVTGSFRGIFINHNSTHSEKVVLENVTIDGTVYTISCDQGTNQGFEATNSTFNGWTSYAKTLGSAKFIDCTFGEGSGYAFCRPYAPTEFVGCEFEEGYTLDPVAAVTLNNCTLNGVALTSANLGDLVTNADKAETPTSVGTADALVKALEAGEDVFFTSDIKIDPANMSNAYGTTGINVKNGQTIDGGGHTLNIRGAGGTWDSGINTTGGLIKNITVTGSFRGIFINHNSTHSEKVVLENVTIDGTVYTISCDQGTNQGFEATNSTFNGWTSYAKTLGSAKFTNCSFGEGSGYAYCRPYAPTEFVGCAFESGFQMDPVAAVTFENCTIGGVALTAANVSTLVTSNLGNVETINGAELVADGLVLKGDVYTVHSGNGFKSAATKVLNDGTKNVTIELANDIDLTGIEWPAVNTAAAFVLDGKGHSIKNLTTSAVEAHGFYSTAMFTSTRKATTIKNLVVEDAIITGKGCDNSHGAVLVACNYAALNIEGVTVKNSTVSNCDRSSALVTYLYFTTATVKNCVVEGCEVNSIGTAGALLGMNNSHNFEATGNTVKNTTISSSEGGNKAGILIGTWQKAGTLTENGNVVENSKAINAGVETNNNIGREV